MLKKSLFLIVSCLLFGFYTHSQNNITFVNLIVTDMEGKPNADDKMILLNEKTNKKYLGKTNKKGLCKMQVPCNAFYKIKVKSFDDEVLLHRLEITKDYCKQEIELALSYELPDKKTKKDINSATINLTVTDMEEKPSIGDKIILVSQKNNKKYFATTGKNGLCKFQVPDDSFYEIKVKTLNSETILYRVEIPKDDSNQEFEVTLKYRLPKTYTLNDINFATGSAKLMPVSHKSLNELVELLSIKKNIKIELAGHTDNKGNDNSNLKLSQKRAASVKKYLVKKGISANRIIPKGYGETKPVADNQTEKGRKKNRRTEVIILEK